MPTDQRGRKKTVAQKVKRQNQRIPQSQQNLSTGNGDSGIIDERRFVVISCIIP